MSFLSFRGRIGRGMWWLTGVLQLLLIGGAIAYVAAVSATEDPHVGWQGPVFLLIVLLFSWIGLCANIKRYHDLGKSGFWVLISFVPVIGPIWLIIELGFFPGMPGVNAFGPPPGSGLWVPGSPTADEAMALASPSKLAKLDEAYFRDYAANQAKAAQTVVKAKASASLRDGRPARVAFGKRG